MAAALQDFESCAASKIYPVYWNEFCKRIDEYQGEMDFSRTRRNSSKGWIRLINTGIGGMFFSAVTSVNKRKIEADFTIENDSASMEIYQEIEKHRRNVEAYFGRRLQWTPCTARKYRVFLRKENENIRDRSRWPEQHGWLIHNVEKLFLAISPHYERFRP